MTGILSITYSPHHLVKIGVFSYDDTQIDVVAFRSVVGVRHVHYSG